MVLPVGTTLDDAGGAPAGAGVAGADGRRARGERTRRSLAEAVLGLLEEGDVRPTARRIAERAGVSLRLVFHHFADLDAILLAAVAIQEERHWRPHLRPLDPALAPAERVRTVVRQRTRIYAATAPVRLAAAHLAHESPAVAAQVARGRQALRRHLAAAFAPELAPLAAGPATRLLDALDAATTWETWDHLRRLGRSEAACRRTMTDLAEAALLLARRLGTAPEVGR